ncbi:MAG: Ig-like domain-containing protein [Akkermansiaceae bacterium]|nr:Ig-like domain-containing protein [Akkermansiaceae bacterium]
MICNSELKRPLGISLPLRWGRALLAMALVSAASVIDAGAQVYYNLRAGNYSEDFSQIATWTSPSTNSWSGVAAGNVTATIPAAVKITANTTTFMGTNGTGTSSSAGVQRPAANLQLLATGSTDNSTSIAMDLNLDFTSRTSGNLAFNAAAVTNSTGNRTATLRVYYSTDATNWTEITGGNLPYVATNGVASSAAVNVSIPSAVDGKNQVKLRFYCYNGGTGSVAGTPAGSRPKISIDDVAVTSVASTVADTTPPAISSLVPSNGAVNVSANAALQLGFSESVIAGTGTIKIFKSDGTQVQSFLVSDSNVSISGSVATIFLSSNLISGVSYYGQVSAGAFKDAAGNDFAGISNTTTWAFTVDSTAPVVSIFSPANGATGVAPPSSVSLTFSESINLVFGKYITIKKSDGTVIETHDASPFDNVMASGSVVTVTLANPSLLDYGVTYYVEVEAGAVEDNSGNSFAGISGSGTFSFTTASVPELGTGTGYVQTFSTLTAANTDLPLGWSLSGTVKTYLGTWGAGTSAGILGNASVFGYQHISSTGTVAQILTLRNTSGAPITDLVISYKGRVARADQTRIPIYTVNVAGSAVSALAYSTADGDNLSRSATLTGLNITAGATFQVQWISDRGQSTGSSRQIGISDVSVAIGVKQFAPTVTDSLPLANLTHVAALFNGFIGSDGGSTITERGFVYALTATSATPTIGASGVTKVVDTAAGTEPFTASITGLTAASSYTMRAYAINGIGTSYGAAITFTTLATPPTFTSSYSQSFAAYNGTNPAGWSAISSMSAQSYAGAWGNLGGSAGFTGGDSNPGVLGYQHTGGTGTLTTTLTLINGSGGTLNQLYLSYVGRASRTADSTAARSPEFAVSVNGVVVSALAYSTANNVDATLATTLTGLNIAPGAAFTISWASDRGAGSNASKQIGLSSVLVSSSAPAGYDVWKSANAGGQAANLDYDGDGISNGIEYFMGTSGSVANASPGVVAGTVTWPRASNTTISSFKVEVSTDLNAWQDASINYSSQLRITGSQVAFTMPSSPAKLFVRLSVTP